MHRRLAWHWVLNAHGNNTMKKLLILGANGHGRVVADIAKATGIYEEIAFLDDAVPLITPDDPILGPLSEAEKYVNTHEMFVAIGRNNLREKITRKLPDGAAIATIIHPSALLGRRVTIGKGSVIMPGCVVNNNTTIGDGVIINTMSSVDHDCIISNFCHISPGVHICGLNRIGSHVWICAGVTIINELEICSDCKIAAGCTVTKSITKPGLYAGIPAIYKKDLNPLFN